MEQERDGQGPGHVGNGIIETMKLSEAYRKYEKDGGATYACCPVCGLAWVDDDPRYGSLCCPRCLKKDGAMFALIRGVGPDELANYTLDMEEPDVRDTDCNIGRLGRCHVADDARVGQEIAKQPEG